MAIRLEPVGGRELKAGDVFYPNDGAAVGLYKVVDVATSRPGKHGSAKNNVTAKNIVNGKTFNNTYIDGGDKVMLLLDYGYSHSVIYDRRDSELLIDIQEGTCMYTQSFLDPPKVEEDLDKFIKENGLVNAEGHPLVIKYSEVPEDVEGFQGKMLFWELFYVKPEDMQRYGITSYVAL